MFARVARRGVLPGRLANRANNEKMPKSGRRAEEVRR